jgi:hypothetical protein
LTVSQVEMETALRIFEASVAAVAGEHGEILAAATAAGAINEVEEAV